MKKKYFFLLFAMLLSVSISVSAADIEKIQVKNYDECVLIEGYIPLSRVGTTVTLLVLNRDVDINNISDFNILPGIVEYHGDKTVGSDNKYEFLFTSNYGGKHYAYLAADGYDEVIKKEYSFISKTIFDGIPTDTQSKLSSYMKANKDALGMDEDFYTDAIIEDMSKIMFASMGDDTFNIDTFPEELEKSYVITALNSGLINDLSEYYNMINPERTGDIKYFSENTANVANILSGKNIQSISAFETQLSEAIALSAINNASENKIKQIIADNSDLFGVQSISNELASKIKKSVPYSSITALKTEISSFVPTASTTTTTVSGGGGGGGGGVSNAFTNVAAQTAQNTTQPNQFLPFDDIESVSWAKDAIVDLYHSGIISGKELRKFYPKDLVKRNEFAKMVTSAFKLNLIGESFPFEDVTEDSWAYPYIKTAYLAGIVFGIDENRFGGELNIRRQDICVMVYRACISCDVSMQDVTDKTLTDEDDISEYAKEAVRKLISAGIISGDENARFNPHKSATRAEAAMILYKVKDLIM